MTGLLQCVTEGVTSAVILQLPIGITCFHIISLPCRQFLWLPQGCSVGTWPCDIKHAQYCEDWGVWASLWKNSPAFPSSCRHPEKEGSSWWLSCLPRVSFWGCSDVGMEEVAFTSGFGSLRQHFFWEIPEAKIKCDGLLCNANLWLNCWPILKYSSSNCAL